MKKTWIGMIVVITLFIVISAGFVLSWLNPPAENNNDSTTNQQLQNSNIAGSRSYQIELDAKIPTPQKQILVYKTIQPDVSKSRVEEYASKFNMKGVFRDGDSTMSLQSDDLIYSVEMGKASGNVRYVVSDRPNNDLDSPDKLPSDEEAIKIATEFLKDRDLYPDGIFFKKTEREYVMIADKAGNEIPTHGSIVVWFGRTLNNLEVKGTQLYVEIGGNGDVIRYLANWREYEPAKEYALKSPDAAFEMLKQKGIATGKAQPDTISINTVTLAYSTTGGAFTEEYLEPVWVLQGNTMIDGKPVDTVTEYIPALTDDSVKSLSSST